jgi:hypothetical protein
MPGYVQIKGDTRVWTLETAVDDLSSLKKSNPVEFQVTGPINGTMLVAAKVADMMTAPLSPGGATGWVMGDGQPYLYAPSPVPNQNGPAPYALAEDWKKVASEIKKAISNGGEVHIQLASVGSTLVLDGATLPFAVVGLTPKGQPPASQKPAGQAPQQPS